MTRTPLKITKFQPPARELGDAQTIKILRKMAKMFQLLLNLQRPITMPKLQLTVNLH